MALAADRDRIARAYVTDLEEIFAFGLPTLERHPPASGRRGLAVTTLHMAYLAQYPDSHIARKFGPEAAGAVRREAASASGALGPRCADRRRSRPCSPSTRS